VRLGGEVGGSRQEGTALDAGCCRLPCRGCGSELEAAQLCSARPLPTPCFFMMGRRRRSHSHADGDSPFLWQFAGNSPCLGEKCGNSGQHSYCGLPFAFLSSTRKGHGASTVYQ
jgi:hypothetical protein